MEIWGGNHAVESAVELPGLEAWVHSRPHQGASHGGDVHYFSLCAGGMISRMIVADVSGHGEVVAEFSENLRTLFRRYINHHSQRRFVATLNRQFTELAQMRRFATAVVATYIAKRPRLAICNAGHPSPLHYRADRRAWSVLTAETAEPDTHAANLPFGFDEQTPYAQFTVPLAVGDLILIYTDALTESRGDDQRLLGLDGLLRLAQSLEPSDPAALGRSLLDAVAGHRGGQPADDDLTVLVLRANGRGPRRASLGEKLDAYARAMGLRSV
jgi:serine phosphatase RsbU (regulator of sigma subunit)